jgi:lysophospholipase L1-like esterase
LIGALVGAAIALAGPGTASAARLYVSVGDSVGAGFGATAGNSYFDLYCAYLKSAGRVDECVNESSVGLTTQSALDGGAIGKAINDINTSTDTPIVTVILGGNDVLGPGCEPITSTGCQFAQNMDTIVKELEIALAGHPEPHYIQWMEYYNPNHNNPFGNPADDGASEMLLLGSDASFTDCSSPDLALFGLNDEINCIAKRDGATPVDAYTPFQHGCGPPTVCFSDALHPNDSGYGLIFDAFRDTPGTPVPAPGPAAPVNAVLPSVTGPPLPGGVLTCSPGTWVSEPAPTYASQWLKDGAAFAGQTGTKYVVGTGDVGHAISCRVTASNALGSATATSNSLFVTPATTISSLSESRRVFAASTPHHRRGVTFSFRLNQPVTVTIKIERLSAGRRSGKRCLRRMPQLSHHRRCARTTRVSTLIVYGRAGRNAVRFSGDVHGRPLKPGRYLAVFRVISVVMTAPRTLHFRIVGP